MQRLLVKLVICAVFCLGSFAAQGAIHSASVPGGVKLLYFRTTSGARPQVYFDGAKVMVLRRGRRWLAVVGIPMSSKVGNHSVVIHDGAKKRARVFRVKYRSYPKQYVVVKNQQFVTPDTAHIKRIVHEQKTIKSFYARWRNVYNINLNAICPVHGRISGRFGLQRYFNGKPRSWHHGVDLAVKARTPIHAPLKGVVVNTGNYFMTGNTVIIDHGQGLITLYAHMSKILVHARQHVRRGQIIGLVGMTGRATGPHLHWGARLNHTYIDPLMLTGTKCSA